jgi:hypothetical protein
VTLTRFYCRGVDGSALPVPSPSGFSVPMAPGSNLSQAYSHPPQERTPLVMPGSNHVTPSPEKNKTEVNKVDVPKTEAPKHAPKVGKANDGGLLRQISGKFRKPSDTVQNDGGGSDSQHTVNAAPAFQRSSSYTQNFSEEEYTYPYEPVTPAPTAPASTTEKYDIPPPPYELAHAVPLEPKVSAGMDLAARFEALQKKN